MYECPIEILETSTQYKSHFNEETDTMILEAIRGVGVNINKEQLIRAIMNERQQYDKGYADGIKELDKFISIIAEIFDCPCNFSPIEWLPYVCDYRDECDCGYKECWKQFLKHYDEREEIG